MTTDKKALTELCERLDAEQAKAVAKYGQDALRPGGRPDYDVLDYAINELVGLIRYGEMIAARHEEMRDLIEDRGTQHLCRAGIELGESISQAGATLAATAIRLRQGLKARGLLLGATEKARSA